MHQKTRRHTWPVRLSWTPLERLWGLGSGGCLCSFVVSLRYCRGPTSQFLLCALYRLLNSNHKEELLPIERSAAKMPIAEGVRPLRDQCLPRPPRPPRPLPPLVAMPRPRRLAPPARAAEPRPLEIDRMALRVFTKPSSPTTAVR